MTLNTTFYSKFFLSLGFFFGLSASPLIGAHAFSKNSYLGLRFDRISPLYTCAELYESMPLPNLKLIYAHAFSEHWLISWEAGFRSLYRQAENEELHFFGLGQNIQWIERLYHPFYLGLGPSFYYLSPSTERKLPLKRKTELNSDVGVGLRLALSLDLGQRGLYSLFFERLRGTKTREWQFIELGLGANFSLD